MNTARCKFRLTQISLYKSEPKGVATKTYKFTACYDPTIPEDQRFAKYTPTGEVTIVVDNPAAEEMFVHGTDYYFDISPVPLKP